jgi:protein SCO1
MKKKKKEKLSLTMKLSVASLAGLLVIGLLYFIVAGFGRNNDLPVLGEPGHRAGSFSFTNQDGQIITEKSVQNKVTVAEYFFTSCPGICPKMNKNLKVVYEKFRSNPGFMILSHTVDPGRDSVPVLKAYAGLLDAGTPGWQFLTGDKNMLYETATRDYLLSAADSGTAQFVHTQYVALLDKERRIRGFYDMTSPDNVLKLNSDIEQLLKEGSN